MSRIDVNRSLILGDGSGSPSQCRRLGCRSFLRKPRLAQAFGTLRNVLRVLAKPFDGEARIDAKGFRHVRLCLVHFAQERIRSGEVCVDPVIVIAGVERLFIFGDRGFGTTPANLYAPNCVVMTAISGSRGLNRIACCTSDFASSKWPRDISALARETWKPVLFGLTARPALAARMASS